MSRRRYRIEATKPGSPLTVSRVVDAHALKICVEHYTTLGYAFSVVELTGGAS